MLQILSFFAPVVKFFSGIDFNALLPYAVNAFNAFIESVKKYWQYYLIALLALVSAWSYHQLSGTQADLKTERAAHAADIAAYRKAQADAEAKALAQKQLLIEQSKVKANEADTNYSGLYAQYRSNLLRYQAAQRKGGGPAGGQSAGSAQGTDRPSSGPVVSLQGGRISITGDDANICADNTARLLAAHEWALKLQESINANQSK